MIAVRNLVKTIRNGAHEVQIIRDVTFDVPSKQFVAVMGPSGSGKSTLLGLIAGLDWPSSGSVWIDGRDITKLREDEMAELRPEGTHRGAAVAVLQRIVVAPGRAGLSRRGLLAQRADGNGIVPFVRAEFFFALRLRGPAAGNRVVPFVRRKAFSRACDLAQDDIALRRANFAGRRAVAPMPPRVAVSGRRAPPPSHHNILRRDRLGSIRFERLQ